MTPEPRLSAPRLIVISMRRAVRVHGVGVGRLSSGFLHDVHQRRRFLAYIQRDPAREATLTGKRTSVPNAAKVVTTVGCGPRFLHSTGPACKGGSKTGAFLVITADRADDIAVPGRKATFGAIQLLQALGNADILARRGQNILRVHPKGDATRGVNRLAALVAEQEYRL